MVLEARAVLDTDKIRRLTDRIRDALNNRYRFRCAEDELVCGASLAYHGLLDSVEDLPLLNIDLSRVPAQHLASLASCVTRDLYIQNVSGFDLVSILTSLKCQHLGIWSQSLGREETQALVQAMESRVEIVRLWKEVTLDIEAWAKYSGQGVCRMVELSLDTAPRYREEMRTWAKIRKWRVVEDVHWRIVINFC